MSAHRDVIVDAVAPAKEIDESVERSEFASKILFHFGVGHEIRASKVIDGRNDRCGRSQRNYCLQSRSQTCGGEMGEGGGGGGEGRREPGG